MVVGITPALLFEASLLLLFRVTLIYLIVFSVGAIVIGPLWVGINLGRGLARKRWMPELSWPAILIVAAVLWPTATGLPFCARIIQLRLLAQAAIPTYPDAHSEDIAVELGDNENRGDRVRLSFSARADPPEILEFYERELGVSGWAHGPAGAIEVMMDDTPHWFTREWRTIHIKLGQPTGAGSVRFDVIYQP